MSTRPRKTDQHHWFAQRRFGYGAAPVTWQGWLTTLFYVALVGLFAWWMPTGALKLATIVPVSAAYIYFIWTKTDGGFRWRWGPDKK